MKISKHVIDDRMNRMLYIAQYVGWGEIVLEIPFPESDSRYCLTNTGVILVKNLYEDLVITAFVGNMDKVIMMYRTAGYDRIPQTIYNRVVKNKNHILKQNQYKGA